MTDQPHSTPTLILSVRLWTEDDPNGNALRGNVRNVGSGSHRKFHRLDDLTTFLTEQIDETATRGATDR